MQYEGLIDTVSDIIKIYGVNILNDSKFWNILTDSYSFASDYSLREMFKRCIAEGYVANIVSLKGKSQKTINKIKDVVAKEHKVTKSRDNEIIAILFSVAISIGSCSKKEYNAFYQGGSTPKPSKPSSKPKRSNVTEDLKVYLIILMGIVSLIGGTLLYGWFLLGDAQMFWMLCLIGLIQLGTFKTLDEFLHNSGNVLDNRRVIICFIPIMVGYIINSIIPLMLCSDSVADSVYDYFSAFFVPNSYYVEPIKRAWYAPRIAPEVGFFGGFASIVLFISLVSCGYRVLSYFNDNKLRVQKKDVYGAILVLIIILICYIPIGTWPIYKLNKQQREYKKLEAHNVELRKSRENKIQDLSVKGIKLGISSETAWEYMIALKEDREPSQLYYNETIKHPDAIYDEFIGTSYYGVFPYRVPQSDFEGVNLRGDDYRMLISLDNTTVGLDIYELNGFVSAMRIYGLGGYNNALTNFDSLLTLYTTKYGEPEIIKDFSREKDIHALLTYRSKGKSDRYVWNFKNGRIEMSEFGIMYMSDFLLEKVNSECEVGIKKADIEKRRKVENERRLKEQADSLKREQEKNDSIRRVINHNNAINEI